MIPLFRGLTNKIRLINRKYRNPQVKMTPMVGTVLLVLRLYLLLLVSLLVYKFITLL